MLSTIKARKRERQREELETLCAIVAMYASRPAAGIPHRGGAVMATILARVTRDGYMCAADYAPGPARWADCYSDDFAEDAIETLMLVDVPEQLAKRLTLQGTSDQWFDDGYLAWSEAVRYWKGK